MAYLLEVAIIDAGDGEIKVVHQFFGLTPAECETYKREHLEGCGYFRSAEKEHRTVESLDLIPNKELPTLDDYEQEEQED